MTYALTSNGLKKAEKFTPQTGVSYCLGASSSPEYIHVVDIDSKGFVSYFKGAIYADSKPQREHVKYIGWLILEGTRTQIKNLKTYLKSQICMQHTSIADNTRQEIENLENALSGKGKAKKIEEHYKYNVWVGFKNTQTIQTWGDINQAIGYSTCDGCTNNHKWFDCTVYGKEELIRFNSIISAKYPDAHLTISRPKK